VFISSRQILVGFLLLKLKYDARHVLFKREGRSRK